MPKMTLEKLARLTVSGLKELETRIGRRMDRFETQIKDLKEDVGNWNVVARDHEDRIGHLETKAGIVD